MKGKAWKEKAESGRTFLFLVLVLLFLVFFFFFNAMLTWKIVGASKALVLYICIDYYFQSDSPTQYSTIYLFILIRQCSTISLKSYNFW